MYLYIISNINIMQVERTEFKNYTIVGSSGSCMILMQCYDFVYSTLKRNYGAGVCDANVKGGCRQLGERRRIHGTLFVVAAPRAGGRRRRQHNR